MLPVMHQVFRLHRLHTDISHHLALAFVLWALKHIRSSACAGEFILVGLSADTIHRGTTMFDRHPTQRPR
jgi:hypothetical protein